MVAGFNMLSFDLFGLGRKAIEAKREDVAEQKLSDNRSDSDELVEGENDPERDLFFWSLYPVF